VSKAAKPERKDIKNIVQRPWCEIGVVAGAFGVVWLTVVAGTVLFVSVLLPKVN